MALHAPDPIRSRPVHIEWAGWRTDTYRLQRAGWDLAAEHDGMGYREPTLRIAMRHEGMQVQGITETERWPIGDFDHIRAIHHGAVSLRAQLAHRFHMMRVEGLSEFQAIDATPQYRPPGAPQSFEDFAHFAPVASQKRIIVPEESVPELLERILKLQQPARTERMEREIREEADARPMNFHGQILSFARAA